MKFLIGLGKISALFVCLASTAEASCRELQVLTTCQLSGHLRLSVPTQILCKDDLEIEDGTEVITDGHDLQIFAAGHITFGRPSNGFHVRAFDESSVSPDETYLYPYPIFITARSASGHLHIDTQGLRENDLGGDVTLAYGSTFSYDQEIVTGRAAVAELIRNGEQVSSTESLKIP